MAAERVFYVGAKALTVRLEIIRVADLFRFDWSDTTFKTVGSISGSNRWQTQTQDANTLGLYVGWQPDPATWNDGPYLFVFSDNALPSNAPLAVQLYSIARGKIIKTYGDADWAVLSYPMLNVAEDVKGASGKRFATFIENIWSRMEYGKVVFDIVGSQIIIYKRDGTTVLATIPVSKDASQQTTGPAT